MQAHRYLEGNILCLHDVSWWLRPTLSLKSSDIPDKNANLTPLNELLNFQTWSCIPELISHCVVSTAFLKRKCSGFGWGFIMSDHLGQQKQHFHAFSGYLEYSQTAKQKLVQLQISKKQCLFAKLTIHNLTSSSHCVGEHFGAHSLSCRC